MLTRSLALTLLALACGRTSEAHPDTTAALPASHRVSPDSGHDWTQFGWDAQRSGVSTAPTGITASNVGSLKLQKVTLPGTVDASPIYLHAVHIKGGTHDALFVTTTYGLTLAIDASNGQILWTYEPPNASSWTRTARYTSATPIADPDREHLYAASPDGVIQKLSIDDGHALWRTAITKLAEREKIASSLNLWKGRVIAVTGGYIGDEPPYQGHVAIIDASSGKLVSVWNSLCSDRHELMDPKSCDATMSAIWGRAGAVVDTTTGNLFVATGNGPWDGKTNWADAVIELDPDATKMLGNYTPANTLQLERTDADIGSVSPVLLGSGLVAQGGKDNAMRLLTWKDMQGTAPHRGGETQSTRSVNLFSAPAVLHAGASTMLFAADRGGTYAWKLVNGRLQEAWHNGHDGTSPVVAGGLLYIYDQGAGTLRVYEPETGREIASLPCGEGHWNSPIVIDGIIALPEGDANHHQTSGVLNIWRVP